MIYLMSAKTYWHFIDAIGMTHEGLIDYVNRVFSIRGKVTEIHIKKEDGE